MNLVEQYRGVTLRFRYDRITETYLGILEGLSLSTNLQAATYDGLVEAFRQAVDTRSLAPIASPSLSLSYQVNREEAFDAVVYEELPAQDSEDAPSRRRQCLGYRRRDNFTMLSPQSRAGMKKLSVRDWRSPSRRARIAAFLLLHGIIFAIFHVLSSVD